MQTLSIASQQWATRPSDERFVSLHDMQDHFSKIREESHEGVVSSRKITIVPTDAVHGLKVEVDSAASIGGEFDPTHFSFGQICQLAGAPASFMRKLPALNAAKDLNCFLQFGPEPKLRRSEPKDTQLLVRKNGTNELRASTGHKYGRIWCSDIIDGLIEFFGDGVTGDVRVPGEFGKAVTVNKSNTTLYASDRDMFVFLADEKNRIEIPNRRNGESGSLARGFYLWNSEVGDKSFGIGTFLFDYACSNRTIWGVEQFSEIRMNHTARAPDRFLEEVRPALKTLTMKTRDEDLTIAQTIKAAQQMQFKDDLAKFLADEDFTRPQAQKLMDRHMIEEGRPIENVWDVTVALTALARDNDYQDERVKMERKAGQILAKAA